MLWDWAVSGLPWLGVLVLSYVLLRWHRGQAQLPHVARRWVVVTGCDAGGLGARLVTRLDALGCNVVATCLTDQGEAALLSACSSRVHPVLVDVRDAASVDRLVAFTEGLIPKWEGLWALVNNAGVAGAAAGPLEWLHTADFWDVLAVNTLGVVDVSLKLLPLLKRGGPGRVVVMSSASGRRLAGPLALPYDMSKCAVEAFSDGLRRHLRLYGHPVTVHIVEAGLFRTPMTAPARLEAALSHTWARLPQATRDAFGVHFYNQYLKRSLDVVENMASSDLEKVIDAYVHALTAKSPKLRYPVGYDALLFSVPMSWLPSAAVDWLMAALTPAIHRPRGLRATPQPDSGRDTVQPYANSDTDTRELANDNTSHWGYNSSRSS